MRWLVASLRFFLALISMTLTSPPLYRPPSTRTSDYSGSPPPRSSHLSSAFGAMQIPNSFASTSSSISTTNIKTEQQSDGCPTPAAVTASATPAWSPRATTSASASTSRRGSIDAAKAASMIKTARRESHGGSASSDGEVSLSAAVVSRPEADSLADLQIHVHGIPARGAKSRVETQIKAHLELVRPLSSAKGSAEDIAAWERIGSYSHLKLPPLSATKRKTKKNQQSIGDIPKEKTLYLDVAVVNASPPHQRAFACTGCSEREKKRADRRKSCKAKTGPLPTEEEMRKLGIDPQDPKAAELAAERLTHEEAKRIILFNCGDYIEFKDGHAELPTRITCYCRHHKEKLGFCILFTMRNWKGKTVACGSTPAIMITDDHKSSAALERFRRDAAANGNSAPNGEDVDANEQQRRSRSATSFDRSRANSYDGNENGAAGGANRHKAKKSRPKPYDPPRRSTSGVGGFGMTPLSSNGGSALDMGEDVEKDEPQPDLVQMLAAIGNERASLINSGAVARTDSSSVASPEVQQQQQPAQDFNSLLAEGSISPDTLMTNPLSLPNFDFTHPAIAQQMLALLGHQGFMPQLGGAMSMLPDMQQQQAHLPQQPEPAQPLATISKVIPGDGPTTGGIEVTILGDNFVEGMTCFFGDIAASSTRVWASNALLCVLPPSPSPGPVAVTIKTAEELSGGYVHPRPQGALQLFTYVDKSDTQLMELALQVVGFQQTRTMQVPREIALRLLATGQGGSGAVNGGQQYQGGAQQHQMGLDGRNAIAGVFAAAASSGSHGTQAEGTSTSSFQDTIINFLSLLEADTGMPRREDAIRLANSSGHTLLHLAVILGFHRLASKLLALGCPVDARDRGGYTALHLAALTGRTTVARILLNHGARSLRTSHSGQSPFDFTIRQDYPEIERMLRDSAIQQSGTLRGYSGGGAGGYDGDDDTISSYSDGEEPEDVADADDDWSSSSEEEEEGESEAEDVETGVMNSSVSTPRAVASPMALDLGLPGVDKKVSSAKVDEKEKSEKRGPLASNHALRILANKLPGGVSFLDVTDRLLPHSLQQRMQAVAVFQMTMPAPPSLRNWVSSSSSGSGEGSAEGGKGQKVSEDALAHADEHEETSRLTTLWRHILDETNTWRHSAGHIAPPPAYETATATLSEVVDKEAAGGETEINREETTPAVEAGPSNSSPASTSATPSTSSAPLLKHRRSSRRSSPSSAPTPTSSSSSSQSTTPSSTMGVEDDWMLKWFWLPCLILALLLAMFSTGPLSVKSLLGYVPKIGGGVATAAAAGMGGLAAGAGVGVGAAGAAGPGGMGRG